MNKQKTWVELLGPCTDKDLVMYGSISRRVGENKYNTLWAFDTHKEAKEAFEMWKRETYVSRMKIMKPNKFKFDLSIRLTDEDICELIKDKIAAENPGIMREKIKFEAVFIGEHDEQYQDGYRVYL